MLQVKNSSPFTPAIAIFANEAGIESLYLVVKGTFRLGPPLNVADEQVPVVLADEYWGEPGASSVKYASEMHLCKPGTDVVLVGSAHAPEGKAAPFVDVGLAVAGRRKVARVFGERVWSADGTTPSDPRPFATLPLTYERAFGGTHVVDPKGPRILAEERNPVGRGFRGKRGAKEMAHQLMPNIEDPKALVERVGDKAVPAGFGFVAPSWLPRRAFAGTYDEAWQKGRAPYLPEDFDPRFFHAAPPEFVFEKPLQGGEPVQMVNCLPQGRLSFALPRCTLAATITVAGAEEKRPLSLETVLLEPDQGRLCLTWRATLPCDKKVLKVEEIAITLDALDLGGKGG